MQAFIHAIDENGNDKLGSDNATVTNNYKNIVNLVKFAVVPFMKHHRNCHLEAFWNFTNRYGKADFDVYYVNGYKIQFNKMWDMFQVSHNDIGARLAEFKELSDAVTYCNKG